METEKLKAFKKGDHVTMEGCHEATLPEYKDKAWKCRTDSFIDKARDEVVFLEGFSGSFMCIYLTASPIRMGKANHRQVELNTNSK